MRIELSARSWLAAYSILTFGLAGPVASQSLSVNENKQNSAELQGSSKYGHPETASATSRWWIYRDFVAPIISAACVRCHGPKKSKGGLRLDSPLAILAGGDSGPAIVPGSLVDSLLFERISLSADDEDAMPPEGDRVTDEAQRVIDWWIAAGAPFDAPIAKDGVPEDVQDALRRLASARSDAQTPIARTEHQDTDLVGADSTWRLAAAYCFDCHGDSADGLKADLSVRDHLHLGYTPGDDHVWKRMIEAVETGYMPPRSRMDAGERSELQSGLEQRVEIAVSGQATAKPAAGRRLTRLEYSNALRDLLGIDRDIISMTERMPLGRGYFAPGRKSMDELLFIPADSSEAKRKAVFQRLGLPADRTSESGFVNDAEVNRLTPEVFQSALRLTEQLLSDPDAIGRSAVLRRMFREGPQVSLGLLMLLIALSSCRFFDRQRGASRALLTCGLVALSCAALLQLGGLLPVGEVELAGVALLGLYFHRIRMTWPAVAVASSGFALVLCAVATSRGADVAAGMCAFVFLGAAIWGPGHGLRSLLREWVFAAFLMVPAALFVVGSGSLRLRLSELRHAAFLDRSGMIADWLPAVALLGAAAFLTAAVLFLRRRGSARWELVGGRALAVVMVAAFSAMPAGAGGLMGAWDRSWSIGSVQQWTAEARLAPLVRATASESAAERYAGLVQDSLAYGAGFVAGMRRAVQAVLISPGVMFLAPNVSPEGVPSTRALARRLSFFLWKSEPDEALLAAAAALEFGPDDLRRQVRRMLRSPRVKEFTEDFGQQWMQLPRLNSAKPDASKFAMYYGEDGEDGDFPMALSMQAEPLLLLERILTEDGSILDFLDSDVTYVNNRLAELYGCEEIIPASVRRDPRWEDESLWCRVDPHEFGRGGLMTMAGPLTMTSFGHRTSPVRRGIYLLKVLQNRPPQEPNIAASFKQEDVVPGETMRQRLARHREDRGCSSCHDLIDPLGFGLAEFDPIGRFIAGGEEGAIDASGELVVGGPFGDLAGLKALLLKRRHTFVRGFTEKLMEYALSRQLLAADRPVVSEIVTRVAAKGYRLKDLIEEVALSPQFCGS